MNLLRLVLAAAALWTAAGCDKDAPPAAANAAQDVAISAANNEQQFARAFVEAVNSGDPARIRALVHPLCLERIDDANRAFIEQTLLRDVQRRIPPRHEIRVTPIGLAEPLPFEGMVQYPVRPTHLVQIDFQDGPQQTATILRHTIQEEGSWWLVLAIPSTEGLEQIEAKQVEAKRVNEEARSLAARLSPAVRKEILDLVKEGRRVESIKRCAEICDVGLAVARQVVDELSASQGDE